jgi:hypothetical protein
LKPGLGDVGETRDGVGLRGAGKAGQDGVGDGLLAAHEFRRGLTTLEPKLASAEAVATDSVAAIPATSKTRAIILISLKLQEQKRNFRAIVKLRGAKDPRRR